jgi:hypothetical protein
MPPSCDYGLEAVTFRHGRSLDTGYNVGPGLNVAGTFSVKVIWNRVLIPEGYGDGAVLAYTIRVFSVNTGEEIGSPPATFRYSPVVSFDVNVPFSFPKDNIPRMSRGRFIPLQFRLEKGSASIDSEASNNLLAADMRVLDATENNIAVDLAEFSLTRTPHAAPLDTYHLNSDGQGEKPVKE